MEYKYTGQNEVVSIGLYYYGARYYDPAIGRFITEDTYQGEMNNPQSQHLYVYVMNNPLVYTVPTRNGRAYFTDSTISYPDEETESNEQVINPRSNNNTNIELLKQNFANGENEGLPREFKELLKSEDIQIIDDILRHTDPEKIGDFLNYLCHQYGDLTCVSSIVDVIWPKRGTSIYYTAKYITQYYGITGDMDIVGTTPVYALGPSLLRAEGNFGIGIDYLENNDVNIWITATYDRNYFDKNYFIPALNISINDIDESFMWYEKDGNFLRSYLTKKDVVVMEKKYTTKIKEPTWMKIRFFPPVPECFLKGINFELNTEVNDIIRIFPVGGN